MRDGKEQEGHRQNLPQIAKLWQILPITLKRKMKKKKKKKRDIGISQKMEEVHSVPSGAKWSSVFALNWHNHSPLVGTFQQQQLFAIGLSTYLY